jgi:hypothetical protein
MKGLEIIASDRPIGNATNPAIIEVETSSESRMYAFCRPPKPQANLMGPEHEIVLPALLGSQIAVRFFTSPNGGQVVSLKDVPLEAQEMVTDFIRVGCAGDEWGF